MVFQFGDFFNSSSTNPYLVELVRATYTIIIFILGIWHLRYRDDEKNFKEREELRQYIFALIEAINKPFNSQVDSLRKFVESTRIEDIEVFGMERVPEFNMDSLKQQTGNDLFKAFVTKLEDDNKKMNSFVDFKASIEYFDRVIKESIPDYYEEFYTKNQEFSERVTISGNGILDLMNTISIDENDRFGKEIGDAYFKFMGQQYQERQGKSNNSFFT